MAQSVRGAGGGHHRLDRQDRGQGDRGRCPGPHPPRPAQRRQPELRDRPAHDPAPIGACARARGPRDGDVHDRRDQPPGRDQPARGRRRPDRPPHPSRAGGEPGPDRARQVRAAARPAGRWAGRPECGRSPGGGHGVGDAGDGSDLRIDRWSRCPRARRRVARPGRDGVHDRRPVGGAAGPERAPRTAPRSAGPGRSGGGRAIRGPARRRRRGPGGGQRRSPSDGARGDGRRGDPRGRHLQRVPRVGAGRPRVPGRDAGRPRAPPGRAGRHARAGAVRAGAPRGHRGGRGRGPRRPGGGRPARSMDRRRRAPGRPGPGGHRGRRRSGPAPSSSGCSIRGPATCSWSRDRAGSRSIGWWRLSWAAPRTGTPEHAAAPARSAARLRRGHPAGTDLHPPPPAPWLWQGDPGRGTGVPPGQGRHAHPGRDADRAGGHVPGHGHATGGREHPDPDADPGGGGDPGRDRRLREHADRVRGSRPLQAGVADHHLGPGRDLHPAPLRHHGHQRPARRRAGGGRPSSSWRSWPSPSWPCPTQ